MSGEGRRALLTGGTSGIGRSAARQLAARGVNVVVTGRRQEKGERVLAEIQAAHPDGSGDFYQANFADLDDVRDLAAEINSKYDRLDALINNAGTGTSERILTEDGIEKTFAVNYVAPFLLTNLLVPLLEESAPARVLNTVTAAQHDSLASMDGADLTDLETVATGNYDFDPAETPGDLEHFHPTRAYVNSKLALLLFTYELAARLGGTGVTAACFHPGLIGLTDFSRHMPLRLKAFYWAAGLLSRITPLASVLFGEEIVDELATKDAAGETLVAHTLDSDFTDGEGTYFDKTERADPGAPAHDAELRARVWEFTADLVDLSQTVRRGV